MVPGDLAWRRISHPVVAPVIACPLRVGPNYGMRFPPAACLVDATTKPFSLSSPAPHSTFPWCSRAAYAAGGGASPKSHFIEMVARIPGTRYATPSQHHTVMKNNKAPIIYHWEMIHLGTYSILTRIEESQFPDTLMLYCRRIRKQIDSRI